MATLTIRNLPLDVHDGLRRRAAQNRRSVEAEVRAVIAEAVNPAKTGDQKVAAGLRGSLPRASGGPQSFLAERRIQGAVEHGSISDDDASALLEALDGGLPAGEVIRRLEGLLS